MFGDLDAFAEFLAANGYTPLHLYRIGQQESYREKHWQASTHLGPKFIWQTAATASEAMTALALDLGYIGSPEHVQRVNDAYRAALDA